MSRRVLLTGATGFVGREVLVRLLKNGESVLVITRPRGSTETLDDARARLLDIVDRTDASADPRALRVGFGDVTEPGLGLCPADHEWLRGDTPVHIVHGAAQVRFDLPYAELQRQNVDGTGHVLDLAQELHQRGLLLRLDYISTAFIAGDRETLALEGEIDVGQTHRNGYERSKMNAELEVARRRQSGRPWRWCGKRGASWRRRSKRVEARLTRRVRLGSRTAKRC